MSTRCQIAFYGDEKVAEEDTKNEKWTALVYHHWDGYPENMMPILVKYAGEFNYRRGLCDPEYAAMWIAYKIKQEEGGEMLGMGISKVLHTDIEYLYKIYPSVVQCLKRVVDDSEDWDKLKFKKGLKVYL